MPAVVGRVGFPSVDTTAAGKPHHFSHTPATRCPLSAPLLGIAPWADAAGIIVLVCNERFLRVSSSREHRHPGQKDGSVAAYLLGNYLSFKTQLCQSNLRQGTASPAHQFPASKAMTRASPCSAEGNLRERQGMRRLCCITYAVNRRHSPLPSPL